MKECSISGLHVWLKRWTPHTRMSRFGLRGSEFPLHLCSRSPVQWLMRIRHSNWVDPGQVLNIRIKVPNTWKEPRDNRGREAFSQYSNHIMAYNQTIIILQNSPLSNRLDKQKLSSFRPFEEQRFFSHYILYTIQAVSNLVGPTWPVHLPKKHPYHTIPTIQ